MWCGLEPGWGLCACPRDPVYVGEWKPWGLVDEILTAGRSKRKSRPFVSLSNVINYYPTLSKIIQFIFQFAPLSYLNSDAVLVVTDAAAGGGAALGGPDGVGPPPRSSPRD